MHMADALVSPATGIAFWGISGLGLLWSSKQLKKNPDERKIPLMGVLGAFVFAAQMINFSIPGTGSSGHLGGGLLLAVLLGPEAAFLVLSSVIAIQALFFADGGLLAMGCNFFNMGMIPIFFAAPFVYRPIAGLNPSVKRQSIALFFAALFASALGAFSVVLQTVISGISELPFTHFIMAMVPIHLAIGTVEGLATISVIAFVRNRDASILQFSEKSSEPKSRKGILVSFVLLTIFVGGILSWYASTNPDGLEWSVAKTTGSEEVQTSQSSLHVLAQKLGKAMEILPDYSLAQTSDEKSSLLKERAGTTLSGLAGSFMVLCFIFLMAIFLRRRSTQLPEE